MLRALNPNVWQIRDGCLMRRCSTCQARGREPWHHLYKFAMDASRCNGIAPRCLACMRDDTTAWKVAHPEQYAAHVARAIQRDKERPGQARKREEAYRKRKRAAGYHKVDGRWVPTDAEQSLSRTSQRPRRNTERDREIAARRRRGETFGAIARAYGLSRQRVQQIWRRHTEDE